MVLVGAVPANRCAYTESGRSVGIRAVKSTEYGFFDKKLNQFTLFDSMNTISLSYVESFKKCDTKHRREILTRYQDFFFLLIFNLL